MAGPLQHSSTQNPTRDAFFTRIVHQHARLLYRVAFSVLRNPEDAEDAVSDALLKLLRTDSWQTLTNERAFLARTVWRSALDRRATRSPNLTQQPEAFDLEDPHPSPEAQATENAQRTQLHTLIDHLPPDLRETLLLSAIQELNSREVSDILQIPEGTVRTRLMRARAALREQYEQLQPTTRGREVAAHGDPR